MSDMVWVKAQNPISGTDPTLDAYIPPGEWILERISYHIEVGTYILGRLTVSQMDAGIETPFVSGHPMFDYGDTWAIQPMITVQGGQYIHAMLQNASCGTGAYHVLTLWLRKVHGEESRWW